MASEECLLEMASNRQAQWVPQAHSHSPAAAGWTEWQRKSTEEQAVGPRVEIPQGRVASGLRGGGTCDLYGGEGPCLGRHRGEAWTGLPRGAGKSAYSPSPPDP